ncbi:MAG TPA: flagellar FlbD family protein [bacterium]|nr:flagellar FlbD family protein [bacterium]
MIQLTHLRGAEFLLNAELIEFIENTPDTVVTMVSGKKYLVQESLQEIQQRVVDYRRRCLEPRTRNEDPV